MTPAEIPTETIDGEQEDRATIMVFTRRHPSGIVTTEWSVDDVGVWTDNTFTPWGSVIELAVLTEQS